MWMSAPLADVARVMESMTHYDRVRLYIPSERSDTPGGTPITTWTAATLTRGTWKAAGQGGLNIKADQPTPAGDGELHLEELVEVQVGWRAVIEHRDRAGTPETRGVEVTKVVPGGRMDAGTVCFVVDVPGEAPWAES